MNTAPAHQIFKELAETNRLRKLQIELTRHCNLNCMHCKVENRRPDAFLPLKTIRRLLPEMKALGTFEINLSGGEIFTHPEAREVLQLLLREDFLLTLQTNATLLDDDLRAQLREGRGHISIITASLYGTRPETHEAVTRTPGSHARTLRNIEALHDDGHRVMILSLMMQSNVHEFEAVRDFCRDRGYLFAFDTLITPGDEGGIAPLQCRLDTALLCRLPAPRASHSHFDRAARAPEFAPGNPITAWCTMGRSMGVITADGDVRPCTRVNRSAGNIHERSLVDIWNHSPFLNRIRDFRIGDFECAACEHLVDCRPCPGLAYMEHGDFFQTPKEICRITKTFLEKKELKTV